MRPPGGGRGAASSSRLRGFSLRYAGTTPEQRERLWFRWLLVPRGGREGRRAPVERRVGRPPAHHCRTGDHPAPRARASRSARICEAPSGSSPRLPTQQAGPWCPCGGIIQDQGKRERWRRQRGSGVGAQFRPSESAVGARRGCSVPGGGCGVHTQGMAEQPPRLALRSTACRKGPQRRDFLGTRGAARLAQGSPTCRKKGHRHAPGWIRKFLQVVLFCCSLDGAYTSPTHRQTE